MEKYLIKSTIGAIAAGVKKLIDSEIITDEKSVIIYGLDRYAFAIRTILSNFRFHNVECFVSEDEALVGEHVRKLNDFASHYLNDNSGLVGVNTINGRLGDFDDNATILIATEDYFKVTELLSGLGYKQDQHFFVLYDFVEADIEAKMAGAKPMVLAEVKETEKEILKFIDERCAKLGIRYWVCGGTLLGTMRHQGFIPWDDDIDIFMPWQDYCRFISNFEDDDNYSMCGFGTAEDNDFPDPFCKVVDKNTLVVDNIGTLKKLNGVWVDIFPLIGLPANEQERRAYFANYQELNRQIWQDFYKNNGDISVFGKFYNRQLEFMSMYDFDQSDYVGVLGTAYKDRDATTCGVYSQTVRKKFEDIEVNVPIGYQEYLDNLYGTNWMELPPVEKRKTHHTMEAYWK